jgi:hypothetical protein
MCRHLRVRVDHRRHAVVIDVGVATKDALNADDSLVLGLVGKHRAVDAVSDSVDVGHGSLESVVDLDTTLLVKLYSNLDVIMYVAVARHGRGE